MSQPQQFGASRGSGMTAELVEIVTRMRRDYATALELIAEMNRENVAGNAGYSSLSAYITEATHMSRRSATRMVAQAAQIAETVTPTGHVTPAPLAHLREALRDGEIDDEHIDAVADVLAKLPDDASSQDRELVESTLAITARTSDPRVVRDHGRILLDRLDPNGTLPDDADPSAANSFRYQRTRSGGMRFTGRIDREAADQLEALFGPAAKPLPQDPRPAEERYGDGLCAIIHLAAANSERPTQGGEKPNLNLFVDYNALLEGTGIATTEGGSILCPEAARRIACDANVIPIVLNTHSVPLDLGQAKRVVSPQLRNALIARDKGCVFPHCNLPARWCDAHHVKHWMHGGPTDRDNMVLLCRRHHKVLHDSEWSIVMIDGMPHFRPPKWVDPDQRLLRNILRL